MIDTTSSVMADPTASTIEPMPSIAAVHDWTARAR